MQTRRRGRVRVRVRVQNNARTQHTLRFVSVLVFCRNTRVDLGSGGVGVFVCVSPPLSPSPAFILPPRSFRLFPPFFLSFFLSVCLQIVYSSEKAVQDAALSALRTVTAVVCPDRMAGFDTSHILHQPFWDKFMAPILKEGVQEFMVGLVSFFLCCVVLFFFCM